MYPLLEYLVQILAALLPTQLPGKALPGVRQVGPWADPDQAPGSRLLALSWPSPDVASIWGVNWWMEGLSPPAPPRLPFK